MSGVSLIYQKFTIGNVTSKFWTLRRVTTLIDTNVLPLSQTGSLSQVTTITSIATEPVKNTNINSW